MAKTTELKRIVVLGAGGNSLDIVETLAAINEARGERAYECAGILDDDRDLLGEVMSGAKVLGGLDLAKDLADCHFVNGIGSPNNFWRKKAIIARTGLSLDRFETIVHPSASVSRTARLGRGAVILQNATVAANAQLGDQVILLPSSIVSHDDVIGDYTCIAGGVCMSGAVQVGFSCYLGSNSTLMEGIRVGDYSLVGMGSVVLRDVAAESVVVGNPARLLRRVTRA